jgi:hypothetical protein
MKMTVFWVVAPRSWLKFTGVSEVHVGSITITHRPDDEGSKHL